MNVERHNPAPVRNLAIFCSQPKHFLCLSQDWLVVQQCLYKLSMGDYKSREYSFVSCNNSLHNETQLVNYEHDIVSAI